MSDLLALATNGASLLGGNGGVSIQDHLEKSVPGFVTLQRFFKTWLRIDITALFVVVSLLGAASSGFASLQGGASKLYWAVLKFLTASISVAGSDRLNREVLNWLGANVLGPQGLRILTARSETIKNDAWHYRRVQERNDYEHENRVPVQYLPTFGMTWFIYERNFFMVRRILTARSHYQSAWASGMPDEYAGAPDGDEPLLITCLSRSVDPIKRFLQKCRDFADQQREKFITVRAHKSQYHDENWDTTILRPLRPLETVHFDEQVKADLVADIQNYLDPVTRSFYTQRGIPYRRGYLLHGPPGTGKTSLSLALAGYFGLELYLLHIPSLREDAMLERLFTALPPRCIVLLEDIDAVGIKRRTLFKDNDEEEDDDEEDDEQSRYSSSKVTLSGLLNVLDGVASQEGRIVCMTSNFADNLDDALTRPGRIDKTIFLGPISKRSAELMFSRMYFPDADSNIPTANPKEPQPSEAELKELALEFSNLIPDNVFTPAQLQGYLLNHREKPRLAIQNMAQWAADEMRRMEEAKARAKKMLEMRQKKRRAAKLRALAKLRRNETDVSDQSVDEALEQLEKDVAREDKEKKLEREEQQLAAASGAAGESAEDKTEKEEAPKPKEETEVITKNKEKLPNGTKAVNGDDASTATSETVATRADDQ
ncbi:P-loop containing nucleoside triphosphate hydrolase protein [Thozetella sp. PMI_491]|nr:P-loop containing nucleoside triphosphate hydrolase protein [Thozetella sp. PMI_491]